VSLHYGLTPDEAYELDQWVATLEGVDHLDDVEPRPCPEGWAPIVRRPDEALCEICGAEVIRGAGYRHPTDHIGRHIRCPGGNE